MPSTMRCRTILVVEDEEAIRKMLMMLLEVEGYSAVGVANGKEGLEILPKIMGPCLILLDLMMPLMNGWEFMQAVRKDDVLAVIPIVVVTAFYEQATGEKVVGVLKKPIDFDALIKYVNRFCSEEEVPHKSI